MAEVLANAAGGYRFVKGVFQYSAGVAAEPGFRIERARFREPVALAKAWPLIEAHLKSLGRPVAAFCACELRSPAPFTEAGFAAFNREYVAAIDRWQLTLGGVNPVARTNVCPQLDPPAAPSLHAFSYTLPAEAGAWGGFVVAGSGEAPEGAGNYLDHAIRLGDTSAEGLREKARFVCSEMERRMAALGFGWADATGVQLYTVHDVHPLLADELVSRGAARHGLTWHFSRPPVALLDYEMDVRGIVREVVL